MSEEDPLPERGSANARKSEILRSIADDADVRSSARFLKIVSLRVITATLAFCLVGVGAYVVALVIHQIYAALEAHGVGLPGWAHKSEVQATGAVLVALGILAAIIVAKDMWRFGIQGEADEQRHDDNEHKSDQP